jgi:hypothetical protein
MWDSEERRMDVSTEPGATEHVASVGDLRLSYTMRGAGEPVVLIHAGVLADWFWPLLHEGSLADRYQLVSYHRVNYGNSSRGRAPVSVAQQAGTASICSDTWESRGRTWWGTRRARRLRCSWPTTRQRSSTR